MLLFLVWACSKGKDGDDSSSSNDLVQNVTAELTDVGTVVRVSFDTKDAETATVKFGPDDLRYETPATAKDTHHEVLLVGLPALTTAHYQIVVGGDTDEERTVKTGTVDPAAFPPLTISGDGNDLFAGVTMLGNHTAIALLDPEGRYVWTHVDDRPGLYSYRMRLLRDGSGVVYNVANVSGIPTSEGTGLVKVPFDGSSETFVPLDYMAHDFVELDDGTFAGIAFKEGPLPDKCKDIYLKEKKTSLLGNHIVEVAPDGTQTEVWDSWDCYDPCVDISDTIDDDPTDPREPGWTFTNALDYDEDTDSYLVSSRHLSTIASVSRATGECNWKFGSAPSETTRPTGEVFQHEHQFEYWPGHMLVFDNDGAGLTSRVLEYAFDPTQPTADLVWDYDTNVFSPVLGDVQRLDTGETMVVESLAGQIERVTADGDSEWKVNTQAGTVFGFGEHYTSPYEPLSAPD
jgi:hypothetical protein